MLILAACGTLEEDAMPTLSTAATNVSGLSVVNPLGVPSSSRLVLHDIGSPHAKSQWRTLKVVDSGVLVLKNNRSSPLRLTLNMTRSDLFKLPGGEKTLTLKPGQSYRLTVRFAPSRTLAKGTYSGALELSAGTQRTAFALAGLYMQRPEGGNEVYLAGLINGAFGYKINLGANAAGGLSSASPSSPRAGEEVRSPYWQAANTAQPVSVLQIAAFHTCCTSGIPFQLIYKGSSSPFASVRHGAPYGQTLFPRQSGSTTRLTQLATKTTRPFEIRVGGYSSDPRKGVGNGNLGVRFWPLRDAAGRRIANSFLVAHDYVQNGCGSTSKANCDYNDDVYILRNVRPAY